MGDLTDSFSPDEYVLRRVSAYEVNENDDHPIGISKFEPDQEDRKSKTGISMWRAACRTPEQLVENAAGKHGYYVIRYKISELIAWGATPTLDGDIAKGHLTIPELERDAIKANPERAMSIQLSLSQAAWARVVYKEPK